MMTEQHKYNFYHCTECERCGGSILTRTISFYTYQTICMECSEREAELRQKMRERGVNPNQYEGCGYMPQIEDGK